MNGRMVKISVSTAMVLSVFVMIISFSPLLADWEVRQDTIGEGIPTWMAMVKSRDGKLLFWIEYPADGPCVPQIILKSDGWEAFAFDPKTLNRVATIIGFSRERLLQVPGCAGNGFIFEWELEKDHFKELLAGFASEKEFFVSLPGRGSEVTGTFDLDNATKASQDACAACEASYLAENDFVFADSSERLLSQGEVVRLSPVLLRIARNEIYARRGYVFNDPVLDKHFRKKNWYKPGGAAIGLTALEKANVAMITSMEG